MKLTVSGTPEMLRPCWLLLLLQVQLRSSFEECSVMLRVNNNYAMVCPCEVSGICGG